MTSHKLENDAVGSSSPFAMKAPSDANRVIQAGFEFGCPGDDHHLDLRFFNQPGTGVDGTAFPAKTAEAAGRMLYPMLAKKLPLALTGLATPLPLPLQSDEFILRTYAERLGSVMLSSPVTAQWYVMHDTGGSVTVNDPPSGARGAHVFIGFGPNGDNTVKKRFQGVYLCNDYSVFRQATTKFEWKKYHPEFRGKMLHNELLNSNTKVKANPTDTYTAYQYACTAWSYLCASMRAGAWLTVTCHLEVDRGIPSGHSDPRNFDFARMYSDVAALAGLAASTTFGILPDRIGKNYNQAAFMNTFPAQYGPVKNETRLKKTVAL